MSCVGSPLPQPKCMPASGSATWSRKCLQGPFGAFVRPFPFPKAIKAADGDIHRSENGFRGPKERALQDSGTGHQSACPKLLHATGNTQRKTRFWI